MRLPFSVNMYAKPPGSLLDAGRSVCFPRGRTFCVLFAQAQSLDDCAVAVDVAVFQIIEQRAALAYQANESPFCVMIFTVGFHVFRQVGDTV